MKPLKRIAILFIAVSAIVSFWLIPGINTAGDVQYTRRYEDTEKVSPDTTRPAISARQRIETPVQSKAYKSESIKAGEKLSKIHPSHFSRAIHFKEEKLYVEIDSTENIELVVSADTVNQIQ